MPPPHLPESSLIIAPNKAASKKRKRPAFRPGAKKKPATSRTPKEKQTTTPTDSQAKAAAEVTQSPTVEPKAKEELTGNSSEDKEAEQQVKEASPEDIIDETENDKTSIAVSENTPSLAPAASDEKKTSDDGGQPQQDTAEESNANSIELKENKSLELQEKLDEPKGDVGGKDSTEPAEPKVVTGTDTSTTVASPKKATAAKQTIRKPPNKIINQRASAKQTSAVKTTGAGSKKATAVVAKQPPKKKGRKPKSTGLVVGASRLQAPAPKEQSTASKDVSAASADATVAFVPIEPATNAVTSVPLQLPPPKEGEVALGQFCSKFKAKPRKRATKNQAKKKDDAADKKKNKSDDGKQSSDSGAAGPVVQIINGEIVLQEASMMVEKGRSNNADGNEEEEYAVVEEDNETAVVGASYTSFVNRSTKPQHWSVEETKLFYEALRQVGIDFLLMSEFFPQRTRKQLKRKYQKESTQNPKLIELALHPSQQKPLDMSIFQIDKTDIEQVKEQQKKNAEKEKEEEKKQEEEAATRTGASTCREVDEEGMEVLVEDEDEQAVEQPKEAKGKAMVQGEPLIPAATAATTVEKAPHWLDAINDTAMGDEDGDNALEDDIMMIEEFHHPDPENFEDIPAHEDDNADMIEEIGETKEGKEATKDTVKESAPADAPQPSLSLIPSTASKKKKAITKKPRARPTKKKK